MKPRLIQRYAFLMAALALVFAVLAGGVDKPGLSSTNTPQAALQSFSSEALLKHIRILSSNEFQGRAPGSKGEELTVQYLQDQFRSFGLEPGNPGGGYLQNVPLVGITPDPGMELSFSGYGGRPEFQKDYVAWTKRVTDSAAIDAEMVFVGYGAEAPEFQWNDFKGVDIKGKVLVVLVNNPEAFRGKAMTYYGRWTYKFEKAAELGAAGCFIIHDTGRAGYPWQVVTDSWGAEQFDLATPEKNMHRVAVEGWLTQELAQALFKAAGQDLDTLKKTAATREFKPVPLGIRARLTIHNKLRYVDSHNVIAKLTGSDPKLKNEYVVYTAHWDHFGIGPEVNGDKIYHGAADNASGTAALLEIARAYKQLPSPPKRTILFLSVTAEEQGLLGSRYYTEHPLYPLAKTAVDINMDGMNVLGRTRDLVMIGRGNSNLDELVDGIARQQGRRVANDPEPEKGFFYRSDHFNFAKQGVPSFDPDPGIDFIGKPEGWGMQMRDKYTAEDYHKPSDVIKDYWNLSGAVEDSQLFFLVGYRIANNKAMPEWKPGAEFKAKRDESLRLAKSP